ncbi:MAG: hypothetical protein IH991_10365, partial [Planctomycetes bacterium]|nr:hypothetical protein [Planctomycetota bacterium]
MLIKRLTLILVFCCLFFAPQWSAAQSKFSKLPRVRPTRPLQLWPSMVTLAVDPFGGEFSTWKSAVVINAPRKFMFRWKCKQAVRKAECRVTDQL